MKREGGGGGSRVSERERWETDAVENDKLCGRVCSPWHVVEAYRMWIRAYAHIGTRILEKIAFGKEVMDIIISKG